MPKPVKTGFESWYEQRQRQTIARSPMAWARLGYQAHDEKIAALEEENFQWKMASGLVDGSGDPDGIKPEHLAALSGCTIDKQKCPDHGYVHGQEAEELRKAVEDLVKDFNGSDVEATIVADNLQDMLDRIDARDSLAYQEAKKI